MHDVVAVGPVGAGTLGQRLRLYSGLVLFVFVATHLINHALGLVSIDAMDAFRSVRSGAWRSLSGTILLYGALVLHIALALAKFVRRRTWRMNFWETVQLVFGLAIPLFLFRHILGTRLPHELYGVDDNYTYALWVMWPAEAWNQLFLITVVWVHACIGLHFWLRLKRWYGRAFLPLFGACVLVPVLAFAGFAVGGRVVRTERPFQNPFNEHQIAVIYGIIDWALYACLIILGIAIAVRLGRTVLDRVRPRIRVTYADGRTVVSEIGPSLLEISRAYGIPHASVCGGRARCSTCRVRVIEGLDGLAPPGDAEARILRNVGAAPNVRLACQIHPRGDITVATLLPAKRVVVDDAHYHDRYVWGIEQTVAVMFADIRGFTALAERKFPYDVVFLLNQYLGQMSDAIEDSGGYVDKFIGDGIMALFGIERDAGVAARQALEAARAMGGVLDALNHGLAADLVEPLNIGIGIHVGPAILGRVGVNDRSGAARRITALGDTVNIASRLETACKELDVQLVVSQHALEVSGVSAAAARSRSIRVKGRDRPVAVYAFPRALDIALAGEAPAVESPAASPAVQTR